MDAPKIKELYRFELEREVEDIVKSERKKKNSDEKIITEKTVKIKKPFSIILKQPSRRELEDADMEYSVEMSRCVKKGILTKAMLAKKYSDSGGLLSEEDAKELTGLYTKGAELQTSFIKIGSLATNNEDTKKKLSELSEQITSTRRKIIELETSYQALFDHTADVKAQNRLILWYAVMLTYIQETEDGEIKPYFGEGDFDKRVGVYYEREESEDAEYYTIIRKVSTLLSIWFFNQASSPEDFDKIIKQVEEGNL